MISSSHLLIQPLANPPLSRMESPASLFPARYNSSSCSRNSETYNDINSLILAPGSPSSRSRPLVSVPRGRSRPTREPARVRPASSRPFPPIFTSVFTRPSSLTLTLTHTCSTPSPPIPAHSSSSGVPPLPSPRPPRPPLSSVIQQRGKTREIAVQWCGVARTSKPTKSCGPSGLAVDRNRRHEDGDVKSESS
ncbi:hypothetical protein E2C01_060315 [Portunus trituberculatus]|uniref:Uncharacterized protein n=1 Tax=Portunus trituberculatus TaxID=210409 RepID=A0A5B7HB21_PORTR|nr:hypothetical protein [Portunus trituberculatus]